MNSPTNSTFINRISGSMMTSLRNRKLKFIFIFVAIIVILSLTLHQIVYYLFSLAPGAYTKQKCFNSLREIRKMENLLAIFTKVADAHNLIWFVDGGTLLGTVRARAIIAYDKDIDGSIAEADTFRLADLEPEMARYGIRLVGNDFVWEEDAATVEAGAGGEQGVSARMESGPLVVTLGGFMVPERLLQFFVSPEHQNRFSHAIEEVTFYDRVMWVLKKSTSTSETFVDEVMPIRRAPLKRFIPSSPEKERKEYYTKRGLPLPTPKDKHNLRYFEVDEDDEESLKNWEVEIPVPNKYLKTIERVYGESWQKEVKWKLDCYT